MDNFSRLKSHVKSLILISLFTVAAAGIGGSWFLNEILGVNPLLAAAGGLGLVGITSIFVTQILTDYALRPLQFLRQAILHVSPEHSSAPAPNLETIKPGRELVTSLALEVYQMASQAQEGSQENSERLQNVTQSAQIVSHMPLPLFVFNKEQLVTNASAAGVEYCGVNSADMFGKPLYDSVDMEFPNEFTLEKWITDCQANKVTDTAYWERVRIRTKGDKAELRQCDMAAYYNRDNPSGTEFIVTLFDRTERYNVDDQSLSFVALAVHELRTPLTILRGYIEVLEDELGNSSEEMAGFMYKLQVSANQLTAFVNNILNVARVEDNQLVLSLSEEKWDEVLGHAVDDMKLKAQVHGKTLDCTIAPNLPTVAVDRVSIYEVINNLIDNAIKYSQGADKITIKSGLSKGGLIETTITDYGVGIPESVMPNLFEKFYRNHRTRAQIGGTGLGLYLSKAIISAHGGQIWAKSKEGEGSTFGFSLLPYAQLDEQKKSGDKNIVRNAHGWIKNHSLYRR
ncbi:MAG: ATP-binding protein [Candidatus Saccharibacteria bacterium]|nr:ATP-binding protein [Candidatus Saccharibacteria bacterium]